MRPSLSLVTAGLAIPAAAILVAENSPCSSDCGNVLDQTASDDVVCSQDSYSSGTGQVFEGCVSCELSSSYSDDGETDTQWMLYNLRFAVSYCLFGLPENDNVIDTPCITSKACGPYKEAIEFRNLSTVSSIDSYDYCSGWPVDNSDDFEGCKSCLRAGGEEYLANFITILQAGCEQQPATGVTVAFEGSVFSTDNVNVTSPTPTASVNPDWFDHGPLTLGAKVGIAVGGLVLILIILGCGIVFNGKRRRRAYLRKLETHHGHMGWPSPHQGGGGGEMRETPLSQRPLRGWDDSPMSVSTEKNFPKYFSPYSSQYNSPVSGQDGPSMQWPDAAHATPTPPVGLAITADFGNRWDMNQAELHMRQDSTEAYELREVESAGGSFKARMEAQQAMGYQPPVLGHPGYGRGEDSPPRTYPLADVDSKSGHSY